MSTLPFRSFDCQLYVPAHSLMRFRLAAESGPTRIVRFQPLGYEELADPSFRRLLAAFESLPRPLVARI